MKSFITYIDFIAYTDFILNNPQAYADHRIANVLKDIEMSVDVVKRLHPDVVHSVRCVNVADTLIFFSLGDSPEALQSMLCLIHEYNKKSITFGFPQRGTMVYGDLQTIHNSLGPSVDGKPVINMLKGRPLVEAERKTEKLIWAGIVIDPTVEEYLDKHKLDKEKMLSPFAIPYKVPYADGKGEKEYCFRLGRSRLTPKTIEMLKKSIIDNFAKINITNFSLERRFFLENTLAFVDDAQ